MTDISQRNRVIADIKEAMFLSFQSSSGKIIRGSSLKDELGWKSFNPFDNPADLNLVENFFQISISQHPNLIYASAELWNLTERQFISDNEFNRQTARTLAVLEVALKIANDMINESESWFVKTNIKAMYPDLQ